MHRLSNKLLGPSEKECLPSMTTLKRMSWSILDTIGTDIDVALSAGGSRTITVIRPQEKIPYMIQHVECFRTIIEATLKTFPCTRSTPLTLELHVDEISTGNPLRADSKRKLHTIYGTFLELDIRTDGRLPLAVVRSTEAQKIRGGFSGFIATYLRHISLDPKDPLSSIGVVVDFQPDPLVFLAKLGPSVSCQLCKNISADEALVEADDTRYLVEGSFLPDIELNAAYRAELIRCTSGISAMK